jgi:predicted CXXCH cytochrome family protein
MFIEWLIVTIMLAGMALRFLPKGASSGMRSLVAAGFLASLLPVYLWEKYLDKKNASLTQLEASLPYRGALRDYDGSASCRTCHPDQYGSWHRSFHRTMTRPASAESVRGKFDHVTLELDGEEYRLEQQGDEFWVDMPDPDWQSNPNAADGPGASSAGPSTTGPAPRVRRRITMVTGSHHMQAYWSNNPQNGNQQHSFPFTYLFEQDRWVPRRTVFMLDPKPMKWRQVWNVGCIDCHATAGQPQQRSDPTAFDTQVGELGIACEACHGPAAEHVRLNRDPRRRYELHLLGKGDPSIVNPARLSSKRSAEVCGSCHSVHAALEEGDWPHTGTKFRPGAELETTMKILRRPQSFEMRRSMFWSDGMIRVSGREYNGLIRTACFQKGEMSCLSCHSMHQSSPTNQLAKGMESNAACLPCHEKMAVNLEQHTHHAAGSSGSLCYNCHMPYTSYGLLKALRSHQISNPSVTASLQAGRPNACNLCHLDKTLAWTAQTLSKWYRIPREEVSEEDKSTAASILWLLKGDAGQRALLAWHMGWKPARDASGSDWLAPYLATLLNDPYPSVRYIAARSLKRLPGFDALAYDYIGPPEEWAQAGQRALARWMKTARPPDAPALLMDKAQGLDIRAVERLLRSRNDRVVQLNE